MATAFHLRIFQGVEGKERDSLIVVAKGLGMQTVICACVRLHCNPEHLVFLLNSSAHDEQYIVEHMLADGVRLLPTVVTNEFTPAERTVLYARGGVLCITPRLLVVDMLDGRVPIERVNGLLVDNAHEVTDTSNLAFIARLYRQKNRHGFLKAFTEDALMLVRGMGRCEKVLKLLHLRRLSLWPRFQGEVKAELDDDAHALEVMEYKLPLSLRAQTVQNALVECIDGCLTELRRMHKSLDLPSALGCREAGEGAAGELIEHALFKSFDTIVRMQLDAVWHQAGRKTKQLVSDLASLRKMLRLLCSYDCVMHYELMLALTASDLPRTSAQYKPLFLLMDASALALSAARERVYRYSEGETPAPSAVQGAHEPPLPSAAADAGGGAAGAARGRANGGRSGGGRRCGRGRESARQARGSARGSSAHAPLDVDAPPSEPVADGGSGAVVSPVLEPNPKWSVLSDILREIDEGLQAAAVRGAAAQGACAEEADADLRARACVLVIAREQTTVSQLSLVLRDGARSHLRRRFVVHANSRYERAGGRPAGGLQSRRARETDALLRASLCWHADLADEDQATWREARGEIDRALLTSLSGRDSAGDVGAEGLPPPPTRAPTAVGAAARDAAPPRKRRKDAAPMAGAAAAVASSAADALDAPPPNEASADARSGSAGGGNGGVARGPQPLPLLGELVGERASTNGGSDSGAPSRPARAHVLVCTSAEARTLLFECTPEHVVLYEPELGTVRELEVYAAWRARQHAHRAARSTGVPGAAAGEGGIGSAPRLAVAGAPAEMESASEANAEGARAHAGSDADAGAGGVPEGPPPPPLPRVKVHMCLFERSVEEQRYRTALHAEREAFHKLIDERAHMAQWAVDDIFEDQASAMAAAAVYGGAAARARAVEPQPARVIVDVREFRSALPIQLHRARFSLEPVTLEVGDYVLTPDVCVERKALSDLIESFKSGRLYHQVETLSRHYKVPVLLIELDEARPFMLQHPSELHGDISPSALSSKLALLLLHFPHLRLLWSHGTRSTVAHFVALKEQRDQPTKEEACRAGQATEAADGSGDGSGSLVARDMLASMPGVNQHNVHKLMRAAKTLRGLALMSEEELKALIGAPCARQLCAFLDASPTDE